jgi:hypothetical protein
MTSNWRQADPPTDAYIVYLFLMLRGFNGGCKDRHALLISESSFNVSIALISLSTQKNLMDKSDRYTPRMRSEGCGPLHDPRTTFKWQIILGLQGNEPYRIIVVRVPLRVWWKKCGTQNDSSVGSRPGRQARGGIPKRVT